MVDDSARWEKRFIAALCLAAAARVFVFCAAFPFFNNVDEQAQVDLVLKFARGHWPDRPAEHFDEAAARLFVLYGTTEYLSPPEQLQGHLIESPLLGDPNVAQRTRDQQVAAWTRAANYEANSPPVYYALAGLWCDIGRSIGLTDVPLLYWIRFLNVPLFALLTLSGYLFCRKLYPHRPELRVGVPLLLAFLPQDVFYSVNSDVLSPLLFVVSLMLLLEWCRRERTGAGFDAAVGLLVALTFLVKYTNVALPLIFGAIVLLEARRQDRLRSCLVAGASAALPVALCFVRNYWLLGSLTGTRAKIESLGWSRRPFGAFLAHPIFTPGGFWTFWSGLMQTFWRGEFVWHMQPIASAMVDDFYAISSIVFLLAAAVAAKRPARTEDVDAAAQATVWTSVIVSVACLVCLSVWFEYGGSFYPSQEKPYFLSGRLIAGALIPFLVLYVDGVAFLLRPFSRVVGPLVFVGLTCLMMTVSEWTLSRDIFANPQNWFHLP